MGELAISKESGWVIEPKYPCLLGKGLCPLRTLDTTEFDCAYKEKTACPYQKKYTRLDILNPPL